jgi:hypothetical protein
MVFMVADQVDAFLAKYPNGTLGNLPSTERLIQQAIDWSLPDGGFKAPTDETPASRPTVAQIVEQVQEELVADRPRR